MFDKVKKRAGSHCRHIAGNWLRLSLLLLAIPLSQASHAEVSEDLRQFREHMFDPEVFVLSNRTFELMFDTARVDAGGDVWELPENPRRLDFTFQLNDETLDAAGFAERTFSDALIILKGGRIVHEQYLNRATEHTHLNSYSMAKSINSMLAGIAIAEGSIPSVDVPILNYMPELEGTAYEAMTLKHLLQMRTGVDWDDNFFAPGPARDAHLAAFVENEERYVAAAQKIFGHAAPAGEVFNYNSIEAAMVAEIVSRATGTPFSEYLSEKIWKPAGMQTYGFYAIDGKPGIGREFTTGAYNAVARDYARLGQMMLNGGQANGRRIIPQAWVAESTTTYSRNARPGMGYAYLWWTEEGSEAYMGIGGGGEFIYVNPAHDTVIVKLSHIPLGSPEGDRAMAETFEFFSAAARWQAD